MSLQKITFPRELTVPLTLFHSRKHNGGVNYFHHVRIIGYYLVIFLSCNYMYPAISNYGYFSLILLKIWWTILIYCIIVLYFHLSLSPCFPLSFPVFFLIFLSLFLSSMSFLPSSSHRLLIYLFSSYSEFLKFLLYTKPKKICSFFLVDNSYLLFIPLNRYLLFFCFTFFLISVISVFIFTSISPFCLSAIIF